MENTSPISRVVWEMLHDLDAFSSSSEFVNVMIGRWRKWIEMMKTSKVTEMKNKIS